VCFRNILALAAVFEHQVAREWIWPNACDLEDLHAIYAQPGCDPDTHLYSFLGEQMVGYMTATILPPVGAGSASATRKPPSGRAAS
jgi:hypothetical protein